MNSPISSSSFAGPLLEDFRGVTLLIGSGLSAEESNGLPSGGAVSTEIFGRLFDYSLRQDGDIIQKWAWTTPFEQLLNGHPDQSHLQDVFREAYGIDRANEWQKRLAEIAKRGHIGAIITTNYDTCIERALKDAQVPFSGIVGPGDKQVANAIPVFKVHGSADRKDEPLVVSLRQEGLLPLWKESLFRKLCAGRPVYVIGYSGRDFDICPILFDTDCLRLLWLSADQTYASAHLRFAIDNPQLIRKFELVAGSFNDLFQIQMPFRPAKGAGNVADRIFEGATHDLASYQLWAAELFQAISCRVVAEDILARIPKTDAKRKVRLLQLQSDLEERRGAYLRSANTLRDVIDLSEKQHAFDDAVRAKIQVAWRLITAFEPIGFWVAKFSAERYVSDIQARSSSKIDGELASARLAYLSILSWSLLAAIPLGKSIFKLKRVRDRICKIAEPALSLFRQRGLWQERYLMAKQLEAMGLAAETHTPHKLLPSTLGFGQLGNLVGDTSVYRQSSRRNRERSLFLLDGLQYYGLNPEYWKLCSVVQEEISPPPENGHKAQNAIDAYHRCEYGWLGHLLNRRRIKRLREKA